ncbi:MAG: TVP38/TMEM64 family protein, partial [Candidatus Thermoplasmatota archaeon]|nr:TVP38/TMEM64 family protein [Candidatus Thermoplasmatota archaeon]MBU1941898.1 TVP38/TMEM64 family protein [Candidatus Thermoplasmatota archaeon]
MNKNISNTLHSSSKILWKPTALILFVLILLFSVYLLGINDHLLNLQPWIQSFGIWAPLLFLIIYIGAVLIALPATPLGIIAGIMFGSLFGISLIIFGATIGAVLCFIIARYFARNAVEQWLKNHKKFQQLDGLIHTHGTIIVILTRLVPLFPFNLLNYGFGLTKISFKTYLIWTFLGMIPGTIVFVGGADIIYQG